MTKANECTCPSGDGSLRHPCPAHPAVEQAGGDERAAFELFVRKHCGMPEHIAVNWDAKFTNDAWEGWQARAALAQPSPAQADEKPGDSILCYGCFAKGVGPDHFDEAGKCLAAQAEQAEAERPEVVARVVHSNPVVLDHCGPLNANDELMTVAQHAASVARWAEMFNRVEQERDAALARVEQQERTIAGMNEAHAKLAGLYEAAQARVAELDKQCRDDVARALGLRPSQERGFAWSYLLASIKSCAAQAQHSVPGNAAALVRAEAKKYSLNAAGMLDSGAPEHAQTFAIVQLLSEFDDEEAESHWEAIMAYSDFRTSDALFRAAELLAAAPGKEGV
ncbi:hypothetical protein [Pseudomonas aeruginosa]|uniref:hypothetical protein n=1 Tax=Pseudomonas aeruginosa TaxID=287 RepID=UPI000F53F4DD|nr:hypothetical protein [Pseudomonas aeruginosa]